MAYIAFTRAPMGRGERVETRNRIFSKYSSKEQQFLAFALDHSVALGVSELDQEKLPGCMELPYHSMRDAVAELGSVGGIREVFVGFQEYVYVAKRRF